MHRARIVIVTPALRAANNGNWQTAQRWAHMLGIDYQVRISDTWAGGDEALMIALHARRSAAAITTWRGVHPTRPLLLVLTGTDLYRDIQIDADARRSLALADRLVVLNNLGARSLPAALRGKARVCLQSATARATLPKTGRHLRALMVGHLRPEKAPQTYFEAARRLAGRADILLDHIGEALDENLARQARQLMQQQPGYRWLGGLSHAATRRRIQAAHVLVHPSLMEGGSHAVIEAIVSGTPVLASRIDGNLGLLGANYPGCFEPGDGAALATLLARARDDAAMLPGLQAACAKRAPLLTPAREQATLHAMVAELLAAPHPEISHERP